MTDEIHPCNFCETKSSYTTYARTVSSTIYSSFSFLLFFLQHFVKTFASKPKQGMPFFCRLLDKARRRTIPAEANSPSQSLIPRLERLWELR